jgi:hypothetical protein
MSLKNTIKKVFGKTDNPVEPDKIKPGDIYGVSVGTYVGKFFVYIKTVNDEMHFIILPEIQIQKLTTDKFTTGVQNNVLEYQETLPNEITTYCEEQYEKKLNN